MPETSSLSPNLRFGATFLNKDNYDRAVNDEMLLNKTSGEFTYKRSKDGKLVSFTKDNVSIHDHITQMKILIDGNLDYIRPTDMNCTEYENTYFMSTNMDLTEFDFHEDSEIKSLLHGGKILNPVPKEFNFTQETNGFFVNLIGRPRDRALIALLSSVYDNYYKNYTGDDEESLKKQRMFSTKGYEESQAVINYTVTYYGVDGSVYTTNTRDAYVRINELSYIPFFYQNIYSRNVVKRATLKINSISTPKLAEGIDLLTSGNQMAMMDAFLDSEDIEFTVCNISTFITYTDDVLDMPPDENCVPVVFMGMKEFENELDRIGNMSSASGIVVSVEEPDNVGWSKTKLWSEILRDVYATGEVEDRGAVTNIVELEEYFGRIAIMKGYLTVSYDDLDGYYVEKTSEVQVVDLPW